MKRCFFLDDPESEGNSDSGFTPRRKSSTNSFSLDPVGIVVLFAVVPSEGVL